MTEAELVDIESWASTHVSSQDVPHSRGEENRRRDQVMALIAEIRRLRAAMVPQPGSGRWVLGA